MPFGKLRQELQKAKKAGGVALGSPVFEHLLSHLKKYPTFWKGSTGYFRLKWYKVGVKDIPPEIAGRLGWEKIRVEQYEKISRERIKRADNAGKIKLAFDKMAADAEEIAKKELQNQKLLGLAPEERKKRVLSTVMEQLGRQKQYAAFSKWIDIGIRKHLEEKKIL